MQPIVLQAFSDVDGVYISGALEDPSVQDELMGIVAWAESELGGV